MHESYLYADRVIKLNSELEKLINKEVDSYLERVGCNNQLQFDVVKNKLSKILTKHCSALEYIESTRRFLCPPNAASKIILEVKNSVDDSGIDKDEKQFLNIACNKAIRLIPYIEV